MGARQRLNSLFFCGALIVAAVIGVAAESWAVFVVAAVVLIAVFVYGGDIRLHRTQRHPRRGR